MRNATLYLFIAAISALPGLQGQSALDQVKFKSGEQGGLHIYGVSVFTGYSSSAYPFTGGATTLPTVNPQALGSAITYGTSATIGWQHHRQRSNYSVMYSGTYTGMTRYSDLNAFGQSISVGATRGVGSRWTIALDGSAQDATLAQTLFEPSALGVVSQLPATFDDLAAAFSIGNFSNAQMASTLTGAPILATPGRTLLSGNRILSYSGRALLTYARSPRLSFHFGSVAAGGQSRLGGKEAASNNYSMPRSIAANAGMGMSYSLSPRTQVGVNVEAVRVLNHYQSSYDGTATAFFGRKMGMRWFLNAYAGASIIRMTQQVYGTPSRQQAVGGGSLGFRTHSNTLIASYDRSSFDTYGFAVGTNTSLTGSWNWRQPGRRWGLTSSFGQQQMRNTGFANLTGWQASSGISLAMSGHGTVTAQYVYLSSSGNYYLQGPSGLAIHSVRVSFNWGPQQVQH